VDCTVEPKMVDLCVNCYDAGVFAYTVMCITFAFQLPLVYLAFLRVDPFADSRCAKFWTIPLACLVTILSVIVEIWWIEGCSDKFSDGVLEYVAIQAITGQAGLLETYAIFEWGLNVCAFLPLISAGCTCAIMLLNCATPVPEFFMEDWADPPLKTHHNSLDVEQFLEPEVLEPIEPNEQPVVVMPMKEIDEPGSELVPPATAVEASQEEATTNSSAVPVTPGEGALATAVEASQEEAMPNSSAVPVTPGEGALATAVEASQEEAMPNSSTVPVTPGEGAPAGSPRSPDNAAAATSSTPEPTPGSPGQFL